MVLSIDYAAKASFAAAQAEAGIGYNDPVLLPELTSSWFYVGEPRLTDLPDFFGPFFAAVAVAHAKRRGQTLRVLDFGGVIGRYKEYADVLFGGAIDLDWLVIETPLYIDQGAKFPKQGVRFLNALDAVTTPVDLAIFSAVLQYLPDWREPLCHRVLRAASNILITRTPIAEKEQPFLQTVRYASGTIRLAGRVLGRDNLMQTLEPSHRLFASWSLNQHLGELGTADAPSMLFAAK